MNKEVFNAISCVLQQQQQQLQQQQQQQQQKACNWIIIHFPWKVLLQELFFYLKINLAWERRERERERDIGVGLNWIFFVFLKGRRVDKKTLSFWLRDWWSISKSLVVVVVAVAVVVVVVDQ